MDMIFSCPNCKQQLEAETTMAGNEIACPSCGVAITIPEPNPSNIRAYPIASSAAAKQQYRFSVPAGGQTSDDLIQKPARPLEAEAKAAAEKNLHMKCIRRTDCVEVGRDRFDAVVSEFLQKIGESNLVSIFPLTYTHMDLGTRQLMTDYGVMIVYKE